MCKSSVIRRHCPGDVITDGGVTRKFWVLPSGELCAFGCEMHFSFLLNHPELMRMYGIDPADRTEAPIRIHAIQRGLFRMNYQIRPMHLTIEGVESLLSDKICAGISNAIRALDCGINRVTVHLFDLGVTEILKNDTFDASLLRKEELSEYLDNMVNQQGVYSCLLF